ncbi:DnaB-like helicase N-terminal domain-containing protein [Gemmata sp.]|uniref:DnaB-like helicase N-terminal domain-containing protein n=1 Tax=Gemmata sp. TaxID=1914242 RepID=UPI003F71C95D
MPVQEVTRLPPHSTRAERVLLAGVLKDADEVVPAVARLGFAPDDLFHHAHRLVYATAVDLWNRNRGCGPADVLLDLRRRDEAADLGPQPALWLADVTLTPPWFGGIERWWADGYEVPGVSLFTAAPVAAARLVAWLAKRRAAIHAANEILRDAMDGVIGPDEYGWLAAGEGPLRPRTRAA